MYNLFIETRISISLQYTVDVHMDSQKEIRWFFTQTGGRPAVRRRRGGGRLEMHARRSFGPLQRCLGRRRNSLAECISIPAFSTEALTGWLAGWLCMSLQGNAVVNESGRRIAGAGRSVRAGQLM